MEICKKLANSTLLQKTITSSLTANIFSFLGGIWYLTQLYTFAITQESVLDEGAYLYKGYLFITGQYIPFQEYGPWTNHMPLSFLIPGFVQMNFGPGIRTGRYFAIILAILTLIGIWIIVHRFSGIWWATTSVWVVALNPALTKMYSVFVSQGLVACMLTWLLVLILGKGRKNREIALGALLAGLIPMTRINMLPVLPLSILYIFWEHGTKKGWWFTMLSGFSFIIVHVLYWPEILQMWAKTIPRKVTPFLDNWRVPKEYTKSWQPEIEPLGRLLSFFITFRFHFVSIVGAIISWVLFPWRKINTNNQHFKPIVFLSTSIIILFLTHSAAALGKDYCVFCLSSYYAFFAPIGLLILFVSISQWNKKLPVFAQLISIGLLLIISSGIGFGSFQEIGNTLRTLQTPDLSPVLSNNVTLEAIFTNKFGVSNYQIRRLLPTIAGAVSGCLILVAAWLAWKFNETRLIPRRSKLQNVAAASFGYYALSILLVLGTVLSPTIILGGGNKTYDCSGGNVIKSYEDVGKTLEKTIPDNSWVYWKGTLSVIPLLYLPSIRIFPAQINDGYSKFRTGDAEILTRFGFWNDDLAYQWAEQADFILIEQRQFRGWLKDFVTTNQFIELEPTPPAVPCRHNSIIRVFKNPDS